MPQTSIRSFMLFIVRWRLIKKALAKEDTSLVLSPNAEFFEFFGKSMKQGNPW
ncbi:MAG: hypothetical protein ACLSBF_00370 [Alphaproteobacteria bacterium]